MELKNLATFIQAVELGSFTGAARVLGYSQSTVSFQIRQLEEELRTQLFERINHTVALTESGHHILSIAHEILRLRQEMEAGNGAGLPITGHVRIAMADSLCGRLLGSTFVTFRSNYPGITLKVVTGDTTGMFGLLDHNEVDFVFTLDNHIYDRAYITAGEKKIDMHFVAPISCNLSSRRRLSVRELMGAPFLLTEKGMSYRRLMEERLAALSLEVVPVLELGNVELLCRLVAQGAGISFLPDYATEPYVEEGKICRLPVADFEIEVWEQLLYHRDKWVTPQMKAVMESCLRNLW